MELYRFGISVSGEAYAVAKNGPSIALMFRGGRRSLRAELAAWYCEEEGRAASASALHDAMLTLEGMAQRLDPTVLALRVARHGDSVVLDLGTASGEVVIMAPLGWRVTTESPVLFRRSELTAPLPQPVRGVGLDDLRGLVNVSDESWPLLVAWLVMAFMPDISHPILLLRGEQGAGKSTTAKTLASLVDPSPVALRTAPCDVEAWAVAATGSYVVPIDNVTTIAPWLSDAFCRAVTGDGFVKRRLYSDNGLVVLSFRRVLILTSIDAGALRGDLADRLLPIDLGRIEGGARRLDEDLAGAFVRSHPALLGALCTLTSKVLSIFPTIHLATMPRMADAARVMAAVDSVLGTQSLGAYYSLGERMAGEVVEGDPVAAAVLNLVETRGTWTGTPTELVELLRPEHPPRGWPVDATRMSGHLRRAAPALRSVGVNFEQRRVRGARIIVLSRRDAGLPEGDAEGADGDAGGSSDSQQRAGSSPIRHQGDAEDAGNPSPLCRLSIEKRGNQTQRGEGANPASSASSVTTEATRPPRTQTRCQCGTWFCTPSQVGTDCFTCGYPMVGVA